MRRRWIALTVFVVALHGCANESDTPPRTDGRDTTTTSEAKPVPSGAADLGLLASADPEVWKCVDVGLDDAGIDGAAIDAWPGKPADVEAVYGLALDCLPDGVDHPIMVEHMERTIEQLVGWVIDLDGDQARCALEGLLQGPGPPARLLGVRDDERLAQAAGRCLDAGQIDALRDYLDQLATGDPEGRLGDLIGGCISSYRQECDLLRLLMPQDVPPPVREHAETCDGTEPSRTGFCAVENDLDLTGYSPPSNPGLVTLESSCRDGRLNSCDSLRAIAPIGSPLLELGRTCAGLVPEGAVPDCRGAFEGGRSD